MVSNSLTLVFLIFPFDSPFSWASKENIVGSKRLNFSGSYFQQNLFLNVDIPFLFSEIIIYFRAPFKLLLCISEYGISMKSKDYRL